MRKFAFFIRESAILYHKSHNPIASHSLLVMIAKYYQLNDLDEHFSLISKRSNLFMIFLKIKKFKLDLLMEILYLL